jgi:hypothetical protein
MRVEEDGESEGDFRQLLKRFLVTMVVVLPLTLLPVGTLLLSGLVSGSDVLSPVSTLYHHHHHQYPGQSQSDRALMADLARFNVLASLVVATFGIVDVLSYAVGRAFRAERFLSVRTYFVTGTLLAATMFYGANVLYTTSLLHDLGTVGRYIRERPKRDYSTAKSNAFQVTILYFGERLLIGLMAIMAAVGVERWILERLRENMQQAPSHRDLLERDVQRYALLSRVYERLVRRGGRFFMPSLSQQQFTFMNAHMLERLLWQDDPDLSSNPEHIAKDLLDALSIDRLTRSVLGRTNRLHERDIDDLFHWLLPSKTDKDIREDGEEDEFVNQGELVGKIEELFRERQQCQHRSKAREYILHKLHGILRVVFALIGASMASPVFDFGTGKVWASYALLAGSLGFTFKGAAKTGFEALMLLFVRHPFDIGDTVVIDGVELIVDRLQVFTTRLLKPNNPEDGGGKRAERHTIWYVPNSKLMDKNIVNLTRSVLIRRQEK